MNLVCDLDGVLFDFDAGIQAISGQPMSYFHIHRKLDVIWRSVAEFEEHGLGFFEWINLMDDARELWNFIEPHDPIICTGCPRGDWSKPQKRNAVKAHFGDVPVITCGSHEKNTQTMAFFGVEDLTDVVLIDDRPQAKSLWEKYNGTFVLHTSAADSIKQLTALGIGV